jgi:hypothetical protein
MDFWIKSFDVSGPGRNFVYESVEKFMKNSNFWFPFSRQPDIVMNFSNIADKTFFTRIESGRYKGYFKAEFPFNNLLKFN